MKTHITIFYKNTTRIAVITMLLACTACDDFIDVGMPTTEITTETVFSNDASATSAVIGIYSKMMSNLSFTKGDLERYTGLSSDELVNYSANAEQSQFYQASLLPTNTVVYRNFWGEAYFYIANANSILEGVRQSETLTASVANQLEGEALFLRAYCHFYLVNLFGDIPYVRSTDYRVNSKMERLASVDVYKEIIEDLLGAEKIMPDAVLDLEDKTRPGKDAVRALLARAYLYTGQWALAEQKSTQVISSSKFLLEDASEVFKETSKETIWHLKPVVPGTNTPQAQMFILTGVPTSALGAVALSPQIVQLFAASDERLIHWIGSSTVGTTTYRFAYKYKVAYSSTVTEYTIMFRLAEQYLIRAEARAKQNNFNDAMDDLNVIRTRGGVVGSSATNIETLLPAIAKERAMELFTENGHRWLDLKRTNEASVLLPTIKSGWDNDDMLYPIPQAERLINTNLSQNPGY